MARDGDPTSDVTLDDLMHEIAQLKAENARVHQRLAQIEGGGTAGAAEPEVVTPDVVAGPAAADQGRVMSRRGALYALGGAAAGGVGLAMGTALTGVGADPAAAANGSSLLLGDLGTTNTCTAITGLTNTNALTNNAFIVTYGAASGITAGPAAIFVDTNVGSGVIATATQNGQYGLIGVKTGFSGKNIPVINAGGGVLGTTTNPNGAGVVGFSDGGYGVVAGGTLAPLLLLPSGSSGPPGGQVAAIVSVSHAIGEILVDRLGAVYVCTAAGDPGTWKQLSAAAPNYYSESGLNNTLGLSGSVNLLPTAIRVFDSRNTDNPALPARAAGPVGANSTTTLTITGAVVGGTSVPAGAVGVIGNVTIFSPSSGGFLTLYPAAPGTPPNISNINFQAGDVARANACTVALNASGQIDIFAAQAQTHVIFDVTGFLY